MSANVPINTPGIAAPTPQNTPLTHAPIASGLATKPGVSAIPEEEIDADDVAAALRKAGEDGTVADMMQARLDTLVGRSSGYIDALPVEAKRSLAALHGVQLKHAELQKEFKREVWELERKYLDRAKVFYDRRAAIISGSVPPTMEEIAAGEAEAAKDDEEYERLPSDSTETAPIESFWLTVLRNHLGISELITDRDAEALQALADVQLSYLPGDDQLGFKLSFFFAPNEFFEDTVLEKTYLYRSELDWSGDFTYDRAVGAPQIHWKEDKDLTKEIEVKKQRNKNTNRTRLVRKARPIDSFFNFFNPPVQPTPEAIVNGEVDEDELADLEDRLALDYQIGEDFKDRIIPHAVDYFTGKALEWDGDEFSEDDGSDEDYDEGSDDGDDDINAAHLNQSRAAAQLNPEECKQQ